MSLYKRSLDPIFSYLVHFVTIGIRLSGYFFNWTNEQKEKSVLLCTVFGIMTGLGDYQVQILTRTEQ